MGKNNLNKRNLTNETDSRDSLNSKVEKGGKAPWKKGRSREKHFKGKNVNAEGWNMKNGQMIKDVANIPFNRMAGFPISINDSSAQNYPAINLSYLRTFIVDWFTGISNDFRSILNQASTNLWTFIRGRNSGATNYQASDILINTVLAATDFYCNVAVVERLFKYYREYRSSNRLLPKMIFAGQGIDFEDFINNIAKYRYMFNNLLAKATSLVIPNEFPFIQAAISMYTDILKDRDSDTGREQLYMMNKSFHHIYDPTQSSEGGMIRLMNMKDLTGNSGDEIHIVMTGFNRPFSGGSFNSETPLSHLLSIMEKQLNAIITDEDTNIMFGDLIKAFGDTGNFFHLNELNEEARGEFIYSEEMLERIHNSIALPREWSKLSTDYGSYDTIDGVNVNIPVLIGTTVDSTDRATYRNDIYQDAQGYIHTKLEYLVGNSIEFLDSYRTRVILDTNDQNPDPGRVINMTRFINRYDIVQFTGGWIFNPLATGNIILFEDVIIQGNIATNTILAYGAFQNLQTNAITFDSLAVIAANSQFDWSPMVLMHYNGTGSPLMLLHGDINNVTTIDVTQLERIHEVVLLSLFDIPKTR